MITKRFKYLLLHLGFFSSFLSQNIFCQELQDKPPIDFNAIDNWTVTDRTAISPDGNYTLYVINNQPIGKQTFVIQSQTSAWKLRLVSEKISEERIRAIIFSPDSRLCLLTIGVDSIAIVRLGTEEVHYISHANITALPKEESQSPYLIYETTDTTAKPTLYNIQSEEKTPLSCISYGLSSNGRYLRTQTVVHENNQDIHTLIYTDLDTKKAEKIWTGAEPQNIIISGSGTHVAFVIRERAASEGNAPVTTLYCYENGRGLARKVGSYPSINFQKMELSSFNKDESMIFFKAGEREHLQTQPSQASVDVWNFNDVILKPGSPYFNRQFYSVNIVDGNIHALTRSNERLSGLNNTEGFSDHWMLSNSSEGNNSTEDYWNTKALAKVFVISTITGERKLLDSGLRNDQVLSYKISPSGNFIIYFDRKSKNYVSYSTGTGKRINLTKNIQAEWDVATFHVQPNQEYHLRGIAGWVRNTEDVLLNSKNDIWRVSLDGTHAPICITNNFGKRNRLEFRMPNNQAELRFFDRDAKVNVAAFDPETKKNGFYKLKLDDHPADPVKLVMGDYAYFVLHSWLLDHAPVKAANANAWLVPREGYKESLNWFYTRDFIHFSNISNNFPERSYNWLTAQLLSWTLPNGHKSQGILYKPENFDPHKKYPVIFHYYEEFSNRLNAYLLPARSTCVIDIAYYVSNGYLVFTPDIERTKAGAGQDAVNTMVSAGKYLSSLPYVNAKKMGLCGHSMGGYKTYSIIAHTGMFAAAEGNSGSNNLSAWTFSGWAGPGNSERHVEIYQFYLGCTIDERPDLYIRNSPIFFIRNIKTPLLMMCNKQDEMIWRDDQELFDAMRRAGKRTWLLQYDKGGHTLSSTDTAETTDFTIRQKQFFDHYLMDKPAPVWMTRGITADRKQIDDGLELDKEIKTPVPVLK